MDGAGLYCIYPHTFFPTLNKSQKQGHSPTTGQRACYTPRRTIQRTQANTKNGRASFPSNSIKKNWYNHPLSTDASSCVIGNQSSSTRLRVSLLDAGASIPSASLRVTRRTQALCWPGPQTAFLSVKKFFASQYSEESLKAASHLRTHEAEWLLALVRARRGRRGNGNQWRRRGMVGMAFARTT